MSPDFELVLHGSCVAVGARGVLILGASGAGKSTLALGLMALGAGLVADDRTGIRADGDRLMADCPGPIRGRIEARGVGILNARPHGPAELMLAVDLDRAESERLPPRRVLRLLDRELPLILGQGRCDLAPILLQYAVAGRWDQDQT